MNIFITFMQNRKVISHEELFWARMTLEELSRPYFLMPEDLSIKTGNEVERDLTVSSLE